MFSERFLKDNLDLKKTKIYSKWSKKTKKKKWWLSEIY